MPAAPRGAGGRDQPDGSGTLEDDQDVGCVLDIRFPAEARQLFLLRSALGGVATAQDFDLDEIADLRMAVDEIASTLLRLADNGSTFRCEFRVTGDRLDIHAAATASAGTGVDRGDFGWHVLTSLTDAVRTWNTRDDGDPDRGRLHIAATKTATAGNDGHRPTS